MKKIYILMFFVWLAVMNNSFASTELDIQIYEDEKEIEQNFPTLPTGLSSTSASVKLNSLPQILESEVNKEAFKQGEPASCFDYYTFGSIDMNIQADESEYEAGDPILISGQIKNNNRYPVTNLTMRARIVRDTPDPVYLRSEIITVDDFNVVENITLNASSSADINYSHLLPLNAPQGKYKILFYAYNNERFNQSGLSFTNDIVASSLSFGVIGNNPQHVYLDQTNITLNDNVHNVMAFMTQHEKDKSVKISIPLINPSDQDEKMTVTYTLYKWDGLRKENIVDIKTQQVTVSKKGKVELTYTTDKTDTSVYFLNITADNQNQMRDKSVYDIKTESNIRFTVNGYDFPRINSFGVDTYPLKEGEEATLFTCYHNGANQETVNPINISTILYDEKGKIVAQTEYDGKIGGDINAIIKKFTLKKDLVNFKTVTILTDNTGNVIDRVENEYNCKDIDRTKCPKSVFSNLLWFVIGIFVFGGFVILIVKMKNKSIPTVIFILFCLFPALKIEAAQAVSPTYTLPDKNGGKFFLTMWKDVNFLREDNSLVGLSFDLDIGKSVTIQSQSTKGSWAFQGGTYDTPPMDGQWYKIGKYGHDTYDIEGLAFPTFSPANGSAVSVDDPSIVKCIGGKCEALKSGTTNINIYFPESARSNPCSTGQNCSGITDYGFSTVGNNNIGYGTAVFWQYFSYGGETRQFLIPFSLPPITYTVTVPAVANTPHTTSCSAATNITPNSATINWIYSDVDNDSQTQYQVQLSTKPFNDPSFNIATDIAFNASGVGAVTSHTFTGISSGTTYYSRVKTWNSQNGEGVWSECGSSFNTGSVPGCNDTAAVNYNPSATSDDGSCTYTCDVNVTFATSLNRQFGSLDVDVGVTNLNLNNLSVTNASLLAKNLTTLPESWRSTSGTEPLPAGTDNYAMSYTSWLNQINLLYAEPARTQLINTYGYMPFDGKYGESLPYWRTVDITLPALGSITIPNALSYYNRYRASTNPFTLSLISPDCKPPTGPTFTVSCSASPNPVVFPTKTTTFTANTTATSPTYRWESSTGTTLGTGSTLSQTYGTGQDTIHNINLYVTKGTETNSASCSVLVKCNDDHYEDKPDTACNPITNTQNVYTCTSTGWSTVSKPCTPPATEPQATFTFSPDIVANASGKCGLTMSATDVSACRLVSTINTLDLASYISSGSINLNKSLIVPVGRYTLSCTGIGSGAITKSFGVKSCILNPDFREN